jgi:hypothetical protein
MSTQTTPLMAQLSTNRMGKKGYLTVPKAYCDATELEPGTEVASNYKPGLKIRFFTSSSNSVSQLAPSYIRRKPVGL